MTQNASKSPNSASNCHGTLSMTESEAPPVLSARTGMSTTLSVNATALSGPKATVMHNQRQQPCSRTALWNLSLWHNWNVQHSVEERTTWTAGTRAA